MTSVKGFAPALRWMLALVTAFSVPAFAQLEALENPGAIRAVSNRPYHLLHELNLGIGVLPLDAYSKGLYGQVAYTFHFSEALAWQVGRGAYAYSIDTGLQKRLERPPFGVAPTAIDSIEYFVGSDLIWKPAVAKVAVFNKWVLHGEAYVIAGGTVMKFTKSFRPAVNLGIGVRVFASQVASFKLDVSDHLVIPTGLGNANLVNAMAVTLSLAVNFGGT